MAKVTMEQAQLMRAAAEISSSWPAQSLDERVTNAVVVFEKLREALEGPKREGSTMKVQSKVV